MNSFLVLTSVPSQNVFNLKGSKAVLTEDNRKYKKVLQVEIDAIMPCRIYLRPEILVGRRKKNDYIKIYRKRTDLKVE